MGQFYLYTLTLKMPAGSQRVAVAVRDELGAATSYLTRKVEVGTAPAEPRPQTIDRMILPKTPPRSSAW